MSIKFKELPDWHFTANEISAGVYKALGIDSQGRSVEKIGIDPEILLQQCREKAIEIIKDRGIDTKQDLIARAHHGVRYLS